MEGLEKKDIQEIVETGLKSTTQKWDEKMQTKADEITKSIEEKGFTKKEDIETAVKAAKEEMQEQFDELATKISKQKAQEESKMSFAESLGVSLKESADTLKSLKTKSKDSGSIQLKAVGDMALTNFGTGAYEAATTEVRGGLYQSPYSPLWLRNILPSASTDGSTIQYLRENGGEGSADVWTESDGAKPQVDHDFELITETVDWIAGYSKVPRSMLDDVTWMQSYLSQQLVYGKRGLFVAENAEIILTLDDNNVTYDGDLTAPIERVYEAAFGQLRDNYFAPSYILMNHRDVVTLIALNKAEGSGEYDLPVGTVVVINGQMTIGGVPVIGVPNIPQGSFYAIDRSATQFVSRMSPEVRFFDQNEDDAKRNLIMVRAEERIATLVFDSNAIVKGDLEEAV